MDISGVDMQGMNPAAQALPSVAATGSAAPPTAVPSAVLAGVMPGRMDQLVHLIDTFSPAEILLALLMANTTYRQAQAPSSVSAAAIEMQLASQTLSAGMSTFAGASQAGASIGASVGATGAQVNTQG